MCSTLYCQSVLQSSFFLLNSFQIERLENAILRLQQEKDKLQDTITEMKMKHDYQMINAMKEVLGILLTRVLFRACILHLSPITTENLSVNIHQIHTHTHTVDPRTQRGDGGDAGREDLVADQDHPAGAQAHGGAAHGGAVPAQRQR